MFTRITFLLCVLSWSVLTWAKDSIIEVSGESIYYASLDMPIAEAKQHALTQAKVNALENSFGTEISETNASIQSNIDRKSHEHFESISLSDVKGEWIETIGDPIFNYSFDGNFTIITCTVRGKAREISEYRTEIEVALLRNAPNIKYSTSNFMSGDEMYLYFKSPEAGYINIFLLDSNAQEAYCLLPYKKAKDGVYEVDADKEYILFSEEVAPQSDEGVVDEYVLSAIDNTEMNDIMVVFSPKKFGKASLKTSEQTMMPKVTSIKKFNEWLAKLKSKNKSITTKNIPIIISKQ